MAGPSLEATSNRLLATLPESVRDSLLSKLTRVPLTVRQVVYAADGLIDMVYFPDSGMVSLVANLAEGTQAEVGIVGSEGMLGAALAAGVETSFIEAMVQMPGSALRMPAGQFRDEVRADGPLRSLALRYNEALQAQVMQTAACNAHHGLEQRLARWLLMAHDRVKADDLPLTQDFIAIMLGVHRPSITVAAGVLQRSGLIRYSAGHIAVLDRVGLEALSCDCYAAVQRRFDRILHSNMR